MKGSGDKERFAMAKLTVEHLVYSQIVQDLCVDIYNMPVAKPFRSDYYMICSYFEKEYKNTKRSFNNDVDYERFNDLILSIVDDAQPYIEICRNSIYSICLQVIKFNKLDFAVKIGMCGGFINCLQYINRYLKRKDSTELKMILSYLKDTERKVGIEPLNENVQPDFSKMNASMEMMYSRIGEMVNNRIFKTN